MTIKLTEIPYCRDSAQLFKHFADQPWSIFLDSAYPYIDHGRYDIIAADPYITIKTFNKETEISYADGMREYSQQDPFTIVVTLLGKRSDKPANIPFAGGALGYFAYDLGRHIEKVPELAEHDIAMPDMAIGIYDWVAIIDHQQRCAWLVAHGKDPRTQQHWLQLKELFHQQAQSNTQTEKFHVLSRLQSNMDKQSYARAFNQIKHYIKQGDCYQINLAQRFSAQISGNPWAIYLKLRQLNPAPYSSFFNIPEGTILSTSPERFLKVDNRVVESKPIKGTRPRSADPVIDRTYKEELLESEKDRAENLMIVDLIRNDIGKSCSYGSISTPRLFALESFARVHHLVSTVVGRLGDQAHAIDLLRGCFPGGSITGAPKPRAMEIIEMLEPHRRSVYCGSIAYIGFDGNMDSNIIIRTLIHYKDQVYCWAGGGIVMDSKLDIEYQECLDKIAAILPLFGIKETLQENHVDSETRW